jgi:hypothetical protein
MSDLTRLAAAAVIAITFAAPAPAQRPVDDYRVRQLESEVSRLQRELDSQARRIQMLEQAAHLNPPVSSSVPQAAVPGVRADSSPAWLVAASWDRLETGMTPAQVIAVLGRPTSTRRSEQGKVNLFFYAMEIGPDAVLAGTIRLDDTGVVEINRPVLR